MMDRKDCISKRLKEARINSGLSQIQISKILDLSRSTISEIESNKRTVSAEELVEFSRAYSVSLNWLACNEEASEQFDNDILLAARQMPNVSEDDLNKVINLLSALKAQKNK